MRRSVGVARATNAKSAAVYQKKGEELEENSLMHVKSAVDKFRMHLEAFAVKHKTQIANDPEFRAAFASMCASIGIDPLASQKGFWSELLGVGDFYFELGVQIVTVAISSKNINGGVLEVEDLMNRLTKIRNARSLTKTHVTLDDVKRAVAKLSVLGDGFRLVDIGQRSFLISVPMEMSPDQTKVMELAVDHHGHVSRDTLVRTTGWDALRCERALTALLSDGLAWYDAPGQEYWFPSLCLEASS